MIRRKAGSEVMKQVSNPTLTGLLYPFIRGLDKEHLGVDVPFSGVNQETHSRWRENNYPELASRSERA